MNLAQLKEILSHAAKLTNETDFYIIGSSAILVVFESPTDHFLSRSNEADIVALSGDSLVADDISIALGELSPFHENHDVYADGCTFETPTFAPDGWRDRAIAVVYTDISDIGRSRRLLVPGRTTDSNRRRPNSVDRP